LLVLILLGVVVSFLVATGLSGYRQSAIDLRVDDMVQNAMPSVQVLSQARTELRRLDDALEVPPDALDWKTIATLQQALTPPLRTYTALPFFPTERKMFDQLLPPALSDLDAALRAHRPADAHRAVGRLDEGLHQLVDFNASQGQQIGRSIQHLRQQSMSALAAAEVLTVGLAAIATVIAFRNHRRTVRLMEERARELEDFAGRVAHDLRSPLNAMAMRLQLEERRPRPGLVPQMGQHVARMGSMIDGLLDFARAGARPQPGEHAELGLILKDTVSALAFEAQQAGVALSLEGDPHSEVACAPGMLTSVVSNLTRNALKYIHAAHRPDPKVTLRVRERGDRVRVEVEDTGPGIPPEAQESIFKPFVRLMVDQPGSGLGLAIVKRIVEAHRGVVGVVSTPGIGSCFWFELPA
jgi:signal transduction histidine kinase